MAIKATMRKPVESAPLGKPAPYIDVEATVSPVDETSAEQLAARLEAGEPVPGSEEETERNTAVMTRPVASVGMFDEASGGGLQGDFDSTDFKIPQLKVVNGSGELSEKFNQGSLLYAGVMLWPPPNPQDDAKNPVMRFVPLQIQKQFRENLSKEQQDEGLMPRVVNSLAEVKALGGDTRWINGQKPSWSPSAKCILLLEHYEGCEHEGFSENLDEKTWAKCVLYAAGTTYNHFVKTILDAASVSLKENNRIVLHARVWTLQIKKVKAGNFTVFVPAPKILKEVTGPEVRAIAATVNGVRVAVAGE